MSDDLSKEQHPEDSDIRPIAIEDEMQKSYMDYAMSVIISRALPDVRDGLKPVHRRILYAMKESGYDSSKPFRKSARIVGDVMGKYHPHGGEAIYDAMVRMVQNFSLRLPLVSGQGNFGSMDGDPPAAMRYTEARLDKSAEALLEDIDKETVGFSANYDESALEPEVLPACFPNILVNGGSGIAVGMATNIPPHNLGELIDVCIALLKKPTLSLSEAMRYVEAPDFPTGGIILGRAGIEKAFATGNGSILLRSRSHIEARAKERESIVVTEIPYQVNKSRLLERIAETVREKIIEGVSDIRDESDRDGLRIVIELKRDAMTEIVLNQLFRHTPLQQSFGINMLALRDGMPEMLSLMEILRSFLKFRDETIVKRTRYLLDKTRSRVHILVGLLVAIGNIDAIIDSIKSASDANAARAALMNKAWNATAVASYINLLGEGEALNEAQGYRLSAEQAKSILELRLQRLTGMERHKLETESHESVLQIDKYLKILGDSEVRRALIITEMKEIKKQFSTPRRTTVEDQEYSANIEDFIKREDMVVTVTFGGYVKRVPLNTYRTQRRGGKGRAGMATKEDDFVWKLFIADTLTPLLFFTSRGMVYAKKVYHIPEGSPQSRGKALVNLLPFESGEHVTAVMPLPTDEENLYVLFATARGNVRRNKLSDFTNVKANGKIAMKLKNGDSLVSVRVCTDKQDVFLATQKGRAIRFPVSRKTADGQELSVRVFVGRASTGVRGLRLKKDDKVVSMALLEQCPDGDLANDYLAAANAKRRLANAEYANSKSDEAQRDKKRLKRISADKFKALAEAEESILNVSSSGMGQLCSAYGYRLTARGGIGIKNMDTVGEDVVASYRVVPEDDQLILITDAGQIIRIPVAGIRRTKRDSKGVRLFDVNEAQKIVACARVNNNSDSDNQQDAFYDSNDSQQNDSAKADMPESGSESGSESGTESGSESGTESGSESIPESLFDDKD